MCIVVLKLYSDNLGHTCGFMYVCARVREHASVWVCLCICVYKCRGLYLNKLGVYISVYMCGCGWALSLWVNKLKIHVWEYVRVCVVRWVTSLLWETNLELIPESDCCDELWLNGVECVLRGLCMGMRCCVKDSVWECEVKRENLGIIIFIILWV